MCVYEQVPGHAVVATIKVYLLPHRTHAYMEAHTPAQAAVNVYL